MNDTHEVTRAAEFRRIVRSNALPAAYDTERAIDALESALLRAGLLRTEADRLNERLANAYVVHREANCYNRVEEARELDVAYATILASRRPKERWIVTRAAGGEWDANYFGECTGFSVRFPSDAEPEVRAYVARRIAEEGK